MVADGEGAGRIARVHGARRTPPRASRRVARAVANSPLVKAALHGGDPNWGRIVQAVGAALPGTAPLRRWTSSIEGTRSARPGSRSAYDEAALAQAVTRQEVEYEIGLPG